MPVPLLRDATGRLGQLFQYMHEGNAESPKQGNKRFNSQGRLNTLPIWVHNLSMLQPLSLFLLILFFKILLFIKVTSQSEAFAYKNLHLTLVNVHNKELSLSLNYEYVDLYISKYSKTMHNVIIFRT